MTPAAERRRPLGRPLWLLTSASTISGLGDGVRVTALAVFAAALTRSPALVATVTVAGQLPIICVGPFTGVLADHIDRRRTLWLCDVARVAVLAVLLALIYSGTASIATLAVLTFVLGSIENLAFNLGQAITPELVPPDQLDSANARLQSGPFLSAQVIGPPIGSLLFLIRRSLPFWVDAGSFALSAALVFGIRGQRVPAERKPRLTVRQLGAETAEGIRWVWRHRVIRAVCLLMALANMATLGVLAIAVLYALEDLHVNRAVYGLLLAVVALGGLVGIAVAPRLASRLGSGRALQLSFAMCPVSFLIGAFTSNPWLAALAFAMVGAGVSISTVVSATLRQLFIPPELFGRVNGAFWLVVGGMQPVGALYGGLVASEFGLRAPFFIGAGLLFVASLAAMPLLANRVVTPMLDAARVQAAGRIQVSTPVRSAPSRWDTRLARTTRRATAAVAAVAASAALLALLAAGLGPLPALGSALNPGRGVWTSARAGALPHSQDLRIPGLSRPVTVSFTPAGLAAIGATSDADLYLALGYVHARFRLTQMDLERRLGEGRLAELAGQGDLASDKFELQLGLLRAARAEWAAIRPGSPAYVALRAYAAGVNDWIAQLRTSHGWPALYTLAGVRPAPWTPVDSLVVQEVLTQDLDFTTTPLDYAVLQRSLGARRAAQWAPVLSPNTQRPFDPGPYRYQGVAPLASANANAAAPPTPALPTSTSAADPAAGGGDGQAAVAAAALLGRVDSLPKSAIHRFPDSNAWAANGPAVAGGVAMLAGDPHLTQTLPAYWYEVALRAPGTDVAGASLPGVPGILLGHNAHISWSITDTENQSVVYYDEQTSPRHPGSYYWRGAWRRMRSVRYVIPVHGAKPVTLTVHLTVHGPVMTQVGTTVSVDWMGDYPSADLAAILGIDKAASFGQFRHALRSWYAPTQNFVYADDRGNIGVISAGYYPVVAHGSPWLPLPGTGADDVVGTIPYQAVPQAYDPPGHVIATANQRPVGPGYPYYIGTSMDFDYGYRGDQLYASLDGRSSMTMAAFGSLQSNVTDRLATQIVPRLVAALGGTSLTPDEQAARRVLSQWHDTMARSSAGASIWWTFWSDYLSEVFTPWWRWAKVPVHLDPPGLAISPDFVSLDQDLQTWTMSDPANPAFSPPGHHDGTATGAMRVAFATAVTHLSRRLGGHPAAWSWGRLHSREFPSLTQAPALGYGPRSAPGDPWTIDAADGGMVSDFGPTWRMIVTWTGAGQARAEGIYPGGQSENPASPWYQNLVPYWWDGRYLPLASTAGRPRGGIVWTFQPGGGR